MNLTNKTQLCKKNQKINKQNQQPHQILTGHNQLICKLVNIENKQSNTPQSQN